MGNKLSGSGVGLRDPFVPFMEARVSGFVDGLEDEASHVLVRECRG